MATKIRGKNFRISFDDGGSQKVVVMAQECTYTTTTSMLEANHKDNANYIEREPDVIDYTITGTGLVAWDPDTTEVSFKYLYDAKKAGTAIDWEFQAATGHVLAGQAYFDSLELSANDGEYVAHSWSLVANGPDTLTAIP